MQSLLKAVSIHVSVKNEIKVDKYKPILSKACVWS